MLYLLPAYLASGFIVTAVNNDDRQIKNRILAPRVTPRGGGHRLPALEFCCHSGNILSCEGYTPLAARAATYIFSIANSSILIFGWEDALLVSRD